MFNNLIQASMTSTPHDGELSVLFRPVHLQALLFVMLIASLLTACSSSDSTNTPSGLDTLPSNTTCLASVFEGGIVSGSLKLERSYANLSLPPMTAMTMRPGDSTRWYVADRNGRIWWFDATNDNTTQLNLALDISSSVDAAGEGGFLDIAFHPDFTSNGYIYVHYTATGPNSSTPLISHTARFTTNNGGDSFDPSSEFTVLTVNQPYTNHNGGEI